MIEHEIELEGLSICIGMPAARDLSPLVVQSLANTLKVCNEVNVPCQLAMVSGNAVVQWARDEVVDLFLQSNANRLFWIDSDIVWQPNDFMKFAALSQRREVVCGAYVAKKEPPTFYVHQKEDEPLVIDEYGLVDIYGVGLGFTIMHRSILEELHQIAPKTYDEISEREVAEIFKIGRTREGKRLGEDMAFFEDIRKLGHKIKLDPSIVLGHVGNKMYECSIMDAFNLCHE